METIKKIISRTFACFSLIVLITTAIASVNGSLWMNFSSMMLVLGFSFCVGFSFLVFEIQKIGTGTMRILHIFFTYAMTLLFFIILTSNNALIGVKDYVVVIFALTFVYAAIYASVFGLSRLIRHLEKKVNKGNK